MRIGIVACSGIRPIHIGGPASVGYSLAKEFGRSGNRTTLFVRARNLRELTDISQSPDLQNLQNVKTIPMLIDYNQKTLANLPLLAGKILKCANLIKSEELDVVLYNSPPVDVALLSPLICSLKERKQVILFHGFGGIYDGPHFLGRVLLRSSRRFFDGAIALSNDSKIIPFSFGFRENEIEIIPNGIDPQIVERVGPMELPGNPRILFVGRLEPIKDPLTVFSAFVHLSKEFPQAHLYFVGSGSLEERLKTLCISSGLEDRVHFEGFLPPHQVYSYYKSCDIFVMSSIQDSFPITLLDAMACKIPIVASDIAGGCRMLIEDNVNGLLFGARDSKMLAKAVTRLLGDEGFGHRSVSRNYHTVTKEYTWERIASRYLHLFERLLELDGRFREVGQN